MAKKTQKKTTTKKTTAKKKDLKTIKKDPKITKKSVAKKIDTRLTNIIWSNMIKAYIDFEYRKFKKK